MLIERTANAHLADLAKRFPVVLVTGARQVGKTTLLTGSVPAARYVTLDDPAVAEQAAGAPGAFVDALDGKTILDEIQYAPELLRYLKLAVDRRKKVGTFYVTGSQRFPLMKGASESLAGRVGLLQLPTLTHAEIEHAGHGSSLLDRIWMGGFPALYANIGQEPRFFFPSYVATYLERDVRNLVAVQDLRDYHRFLRALALRSGQLVNFADLSRDVSVAPNTAKAWLSVLGASGLVTVVEPWARNRTLRMVKTPKVYFSDTGLLCYLVGIQSPAQLRSSAMLGAIWETFAFAQIQAHFWNRGETDPPIFFFRTKDGQEVDFVVESGGELFAVECKAKENLETRDVRGFDAFAGMVGSGAKIRRVHFAMVARPYAARDWRVENGLGLDELFGEGSGRRRYAPSATSTSSDRTKR